MMWRKGFILALILASLIGFAAIPTSAQSGVVWNGEYYNNANLQAPSVLKRQDGAIAFDWGAGSPAAGVNADNFSVRWGADPSFQAGTYRFYIQADDNVKVWLDFGRAPVIDTFGAGKVAQIVTADVTLTAGSHHIQVDYQELGGNAFVYFSWANLATNPSGPNFPIPGSNPSLPPLSSGPWTAQYFANANLLGTPTLIQTEATPSHNWGTGSPVASLPADNYSARWTSVQTLNGGTYQLNVRADDGVRVTIDGVTYINEWHTATGATYTANVNLFAGQHNFIVEFFEVGGVAFLDYNFLPVGNAVPTPTQPPVITGALITVTGAFKLNVRNAPSAITGQILTKINRNESYPIVGRNANMSWWQINVNGIIGWVRASFVTAINAQNVPVTSGGIPTAPTPIPAANCLTAPAPHLVIGKLARVTGGLPNNIRSLATATSPRIGQIPAGSTFLVLGGPQCAEGFYWWQINFNGTVGWTVEGFNGQYFVDPIQ